MIQKHLQLTTTLAKFNIDSSMDEDEIVACLKKKFYENEKTRISLLQSCIDSLGEFREGCGSGSPSVTEKIELLLSSAAVVGSENDARAALEKIYQYEKSIIEKFLSCIEFEDNDLFTRSLYKTESLRKFYIDKKNYTNWFAFHPLRDPSRLFANYSLAFLEQLELCYQLCEVYQDRVGIDAKEMNHYLLRMKDKVESYIDSRGFLEKVKNLLKFTQKDKKQVVYYANCYNKVIDCFLTDLRYLLPVGDFCVFLDTERSRQMGGGLFISKDQLRSHLENLAQLIARNAPNDSEQVVGALENIEKLMRLWASSNFTSMYRVLKDKELVKQGLTGTDNNLVNKNQKIYKI